MTANAQEKTTGRVVSIDALRGFDMFWIIGGGTFFMNLFTWLDTPFFRGLAGQFAHTPWNGFTFEDFIFPLFLFIVGLSIPFSLTKRLARGDDRRDLYLHILKRFLILFALGLIYNGLFNFDLPHQRLMGVLQRISLCYLFASLIVMNFSPKGQAVWTVLLLLFYWAAMTLIPVPGYGAGVLTPEGNLTTFIDEYILPGKLSNYGLGHRGDANGVLSTIPAISSALLGVLCGHWIRSDFSHSVKIRRLLLAGAGCIVSSLLWDLVFPINKPLWTSSYVLFAGGLSMILFTFFYWVIDVRGYRKWAFPFVIVGLNSITIYVIGGLFDFGVIAAIFIHGFVNSMGAFKPAFQALCAVSVKWLFLYFLWRQKIFLKV